MVNVNIQACLENTKWAGERTSISLQTLLLLRFGWASFLQQFLEVLLQGKIERFHRHHPSQIEEKLFRSLLQHHMENQILTVHEPNMPHNCLHRLPGLPRQIF